MNAVAQSNRIGSFQGEDVLECRLQSPEGVVVSVMSWGAVVRDWQVPLPDGSLRSVVLGFDQFEQYPRMSPFFGAIIGRVANRIGGAKFTLDGKEFQLEANEGGNQLHGGPSSFGQRLWQITELNQNMVRLELNSPDGEGGYPGNVTARVTYKLTGHKLRILMEAETDAPTPVNMVQHNYFNLAGHGDIRGHSLRLDAHSFTPTDSSLVPTGQILPVDGTELDFRSERPLMDQRGQPLALDQNLVLTKGRAEGEPAAVLDAPDKSLRLTLWTDQPAVQVYTPTNVLGLHYPPFAAICLEDQNFPDAVNRPNFPSPIVRPGQPYSHACHIQISPPDAPLIEG